MTNVVKPTMCTKKYIWQTFWSEIVEPNQAAVLETDQELKAITAERLYWQVQPKTTSWMLGG